MADTGRYRFSEWILHNWSQAGSIAAVLLVLVSPAIVRSTGYTGLLIFLWLPIYMVHQYEEYALGDFLGWTRRMMPRSFAFLTVRKVLAINLGLVWLPYLVSFYAAWSGNFAVALYAPYLAGVNALLHVMWWLRFRVYNPGLVTALILFAPGAYYTIVSVSGAVTVDHLTALGGAVLVHLVLVGLGRGMFLKTL
jgi:hypothetical protein